MNNIKTNDLHRTSKYLKEPRENKIFKRVSVLYLFAYYILPPYFGIPAPGFDLTGLRIMLIIAALMIVSDFDRYTFFVNMVRKEKITYFFLPYMFVIAYTMVLRIDFNAFLNPFLEIVEMFLLIYMIRESLGVDETVRLVIFFIWILAILGIEEGITTVSPFSYLKNLDGIYAGRYIRAGNYRTMSNCAHSLGFGLLLSTMLPFAGYDIEKKELNVFKRPVLLALLMVNVFLNGSRSTLGISFAEVAVMFVLSDRKYLKKNVLLVSIVAVIGAGLLVVIDTIFGTSYSVKYGANLTLLSSSSAYRDQLKGIFGVTWLNPLLGIGRKRNFMGMVNGNRIISIDSFYIAEYVRYAYPGMISYIFMLACTGFIMLKDMIKTRSALIRVLLISSVMYCIDLYVIDSLMTLKYLYLNIAIFVCLETTPYVTKEDTCKYLVKRKSAYVR